MRGYMAPVLLQRYERRRLLSSDLLFLVRSVVRCFNLMLVFYYLLFFFLFFSAVFCSFVLRPFCVALFSFFLCCSFPFVFVLFFVLCFIFCYLVLLPFIFCFLLLLSLLLFPVVLFFFLNFASFFFFSPHPPPSFRTLCEIMGSRLIWVHPFETIFADIIPWHLSMLGKPLYVNELLCGSRLSVLRLISHVWHLFMSVSKRTVTESGVSKLPVPSRDWIRFRVKISVKNRCGNAFRSEDAI